MAREHRATVPWPLPLCRQVQGDVTRGLLILHEQQDTISLYGQGRGLLESAPFA
jgi:hypothetical protein